MSSFCNAAIILCPSDADPHRRLLGLTLGERVLLALSHSGVTQVCFVGDGPRPSCDRAPLQVVKPAELDLSLTYAVLASDTVFDRSLLSESALPDDIAMTYCTGAQVTALLDDATAATSALGAGQAQSGRGFALRVDSSATARKAQRALLLSLRKPIDGFISTHLNRHISLFCTRFLVKTGLPPNFFTVIFLLIGLAAAGFATQAQYSWALVLAGLLFQAQSVLDGCDGEMARLTYQFSRRGQWLDSIGDDITNYSVCFGLAVGQAIVRHDPMLYWLGGAVLLMQVVTSGVLYRRMVLLGTGDLLAIPDLVRTGQPQGVTGFISDAISLALKRDTFIFALATLVVLQQPLLAFYLYGLGTIPMAVGVLLNDYRIAQQSGNEQTASA